ncbi:hypothetical protein [Mesorhizobium sp. ZC-5]|uniref:hypothetical protein n=1 Tax=Mesorhizobium sp. ZC-5 TaxID=2986066 RepID=UPI0021E81B94|nr:hypothetical protein [Mesorhizobium sp. ZC-5]MCV3243295.1 hypothetical protein [Mesorhizobium sp. ZC-5]
MAEAGDNLRVQSPKGGGMIVQFRRIVALVTAGSLALSAGAVLPQAWLAGRMLLDRPDAYEIAVYELSRLSAADYEPAIENALEDGDVDLADSMVDLARQHQVVLPPGLTGRVEAEAASTALESASDAWDGFISGEASNEAALSGAITADLVGYGDVRDLSAQAGAYLNGEPVDHVTVAVASAGLALTGTTLLSLGSASPATVPAKVGLSTIKLARRAGKMSMGLVDDVAKMARRSINDAALADLGRAAKSLDPRAMLSAARSLVKQDAVKTFADLGDDVSAIGRNSGHRGVMDVLARAENVDDVRQAARVSNNYGKGTRGAFHFIGRMTLKLSAFLYHMFGWLLTAAIWLAGALWLLFRFISWASRPFRTVPAR